MEEKREEIVLMGEFAFEGGHREGPDFLQHLEDRRQGMPRQNASLTSSYVGPDGWSAPEGNQSTAADKPPVKVYRMDSHGLGTRGAGLMGEIPHDMVEDLVCTGIIPPYDRATAESVLEKHLKENWGGGRYRLLTGDRANDYICVVSGLSIGFPLDEEASEPPLTPSDGGGVKGVLATKVVSEQIETGVTVWLDLSRDGPYKVVGPYNHPLGASVPAHHPHDAPNTFETVRVVEGLWLCQDVKGVVHILAEGSLTTTPPASRFSKLNQAASWCWAKREVVLWVAIASMAAALAL